MRQAEKEYKTVDEYIAFFPNNLQIKLQELRQTIRESAPDAEEVISYGMPAYRLSGILVYFAAFKKHIGFYPTSSGVEAFREELSDYETSKGTIRFPLNKPIPLELVTKIVKFRVDENMCKKKQA
ncbi:TPA: DUF1801 domain-containing protein [Candidatus Bathyarchaeota archaeon]|nr:DUF1801 domain-containing protein [Candidatus Bathyarchaeota archaeon]